MKFKAERIKTLIKHEILNLIASGSISDPRIPAFITITKVTLSKDLHYSHIYYTTQAEEAKKKESEAGLNSAVGFIQKHLAQNLNLRFTPKLEFRYDVNEEKADQVDQLLTKLSQDRDKTE